MPKKQGGHLTMKDRRDIEDRLHDGESLNSIASHLEAVRNQNGALERLSGVLPVQSDRFA
ncbi:helix-turn-helix domain-containing protein [Gordonibacter urolithinfaciens]|uniref:helix-turn-helix domain-containing protein n=1 Tax=Gordonibacter urolithinfaciens TaxID=1335613 RepID=UPI000F4C43C0|nr:helix-turn-helix domain-containing protein [Gordonibacter urolithinfaciens]ROT89829.1 hypothetical protein DMP13_10485 [Gordonibacter urolithinfaciens]